MKANSRAFLAISASLVLASCGYVGDPLYPALNIPSRVTDLRAIERGNNIEVDFTIPPLTTEGLIVKQIGGIELRIGPNKSDPFNADEWASSATKVDIPVPDKIGPAHAAVAAQPFIGQHVIIGVRATNTKGRASEWSNFATLSVQAPLATPAEVTTELAPQGLLLKWHA